MAGTARMAAERRAFLAVIAVAILLRIAMYVLYGPLYQPDSSSFTSLVPKIMQGREWLSAAKIHDQSGHDLTLRMLGYPVLITGLKYLFGVSVDHAVVILQAGVSVLATALVFHMARGLGLGLAASVFAALAHTSSIALLFDFNILVDSLFANGLLIAAASLVLGIRRGGAPGLPALLGISMLLVTAFLLRETAEYFVIFWALGVMIWCRKASVSLRRTVTCVLVFLLPVIAASVGYREWNRYRTGVYFVTTGAQYSMWFAPVEVARERGTSLFAADAGMVEALEDALKTNPDFPMEGAVAINHYYFARGLTSVEIGGQAFRAFFTALREAPGTLLRDRLTRFRARAVLLLVNASFPQEVMLDLSLKRDNTAFGAKARAALAQGGVSGLVTLALMGVEVAQLAISAILLLAFVLGVPVILTICLWREKRLGEVQIILGWFWLMYGAINGAYILVSFEGRYAMATLPLACIGGLWVCSRGLQAWRAARNVSYSRM